jgi:PAS domain-containing protein
MKESEENSNNPGEATDEYERLKREAINKKGKEFSLSKGDVCEKTTGAWEWDIASDLSRFSVGVCNMMGVEQSETVRGYFSAFQYVPAEEWQKLQDALMVSVQNKAPFDVECHAVRSDGTILQIRIIGQLTCDAEGNPAHMEGTIEDITAG